MSVVTAVLNQRAKDKYSRLITSVEITAGLLPEIEKHIKRMDRRKQGRTYRMRTPDELLALVAAFRKGMSDFTENCKKYEKELTTKDWTV